ncbi:MAG: hypothetical protein ABI600_06690 [Luteolibacter sp.]
MRAYLLVLGFCLAAITSAEEIPRAVQITEPPEQMKSLGLDRVISRSKQFRVGGGDGLVRGTVAILAEETKDELLRLTEENDEWKIPVTIILHGKSGDPMPLRTVSMQLLVSENGYDLRMDVHLSRGVERERFKYAATSALLYERSLLGRTAADDERPLRVPPWLADGLLEATDWRLNRSDRRLYEALFKTGGLFKIDDLMAIGENDFENLDGATRAAFRVSSGALVMALLEQPQGKQGFRAFLSDVAGFEGEMPTLLRKYFPELNLSETSLAKWWTLQLASKGGLTLLTDILTINQTEAALSEALHLSFRSEEGILQQKELSAWPELVGLKEIERIAAVRLAQDALVRLSYRCFPSYRPLLSEYQLILTTIAKNKTADVDIRLAALQDTRATMKAKATRARDYLDWFEITRARETSGVFDDYMRLKDRLKANPHQRKDELSLYLDRMDKIFHREETKNRAMPPP